MDHDKRIHDVCQGHHSLELFASIVCYSSCLDSFRLTNDFLAMMKDLIYASLSTEMFRDRVDHQRQECFALMN
jgi:hypothetical protein